MDFQKVFEAAFCLQDSIHVSLVGYIDRVLPDIHEWGDLFKALSAAMPHVYGHDGTDADAANIIPYCEPAYLLLWRLSSPHTDADEVQLESFHTEMSNIRAAFIAAGVNDAGNWKQS